MLCNLSANVFDSFFAECCGKVQQANAPCQPQPEEKTFLQYALKRNGSPLQGPVVHVLFQRVSRCESNCLNFRASRDQHRMRVHAKTKVWLPCPIFQIVARFETLACKIRNLVLRNASCI